MFIRHGPFRPFRIGRFRPSKIGTLANARPARMTYRHSSTLRARGSYTATVPASTHKSKSWFSVALPVSRSGDGQQLRVDFNDGLLSQMSLPNSVAATGGNTAEAI